MNGQTSEKATVPLSGNALAVYSSSGLLYYAHTDLLGSIRLGTTSARAKYFDTAYAPFGETYASSGTLDPAYTGQMDDTAHRQDTAGGLYDFPAREYSTQGRWPNPDPLGKGATCPKDPQTQNRYAYVRNNPMTYTDPTGTVTIPGPWWPWPGGPGGCDPEVDPTCSPDCDPDDPFCGGGGGSGGGGGGGGGKPEQPRTFPWLYLPVGLFDNKGTYIPLRTGSCITSPISGSYLKCNWANDTCVKTASGGPYEGCSDASTVYYHKGGNVIYEFCCPQLEVGPDCGEIMSERRCNSTNKLPH